MRKSLSLPVIFLIVSLIVLAHAVFATGSPVLAPNPIPSSCSSNCKPIIISGPNLGFAITFSQNNSVIGHFKKTLGPDPFNVTLTNNGSCSLNSLRETPIPANTDGPISPLRSIGYLYCLYYTTLPITQDYSLRIVFKHPGDVQFDQTISWTIP